MTCAGVGACVGVSAYAEPVPSTAATASATGLLKYAEFMNISEVSCKEE
jgi:hypothetical protein